MKKSNDTTGNRTRDLPTCSAVPQPTAPPRAPRYCEVAGQIHHQTYKPPVPVQYSVGWAPKSVWTFRETKNLLPITGRWYSPYPGHCTDWTISAHVIFIDQGWRSYGTRHSLLTQFLLFTLPDQRLCIVTNMYIQGFKLKSGPLTKP